MSPIALAALTAVASATGSLDFGERVMTSLRAGDWMQTYSGRQFWPVDPRAEDVFIEDIAHSLSMACRYAGHCLRFYSVAEHSVHLSRYVPEPFKLWALLHDASEAYLVDVPRPLKPSLTGYAALERRVMDEVALRFGLGVLMPPEVKDADNRILIDESQQNMSPCVQPWNLPGEPLGVTLEYWSPEVAEAKFLAAFEELYAETK